MFYIYAEKSLVGMQKVDDQNKPGSEPIMISIILLSGLAEPDPFPFALRILDFWSCIRAL